MRSECSVFAEYAIKSITGVKYTLSSYIEHWYVDIFKQYTTSPSYLQTTDWAIQRVILPSIEEDHLLINLTPEYINDILQRCAKLPYRTAGIVSRKILCTILKTAEAEELLDIKFSFESIITFPRIPPKYIAYEKEDICKLLEIAKKSDAIYLEILLCLFAGLRIGDDDDKIRLNQRKPSKYKGLRRFGPEKNLQRINKFMKERPIFYKNLIQMKENIRFYLRCFYCITKVMILQFNSENRTELARNG